MARLSELKKDFMHLIGRGRLSHAYLFFGEQDYAMREAALSLASFLERKEWVFSSEVLIDAIVADGREAGIDEVRNWIQRIAEAPFIASRRTLFVAHADRLTLPASHALLKLVEEPPESALIVFSARHPEAILPTLASRFQKIFVSGKNESGNDAISQEYKAYAARILEARTSKERSDALKEMRDEEVDLESVASAIFQDLRKDARKNWRLIRSLLYRFSVMHQFNVNKKLQLEAAFSITYNL